MRSARGGGNRGAAAGDSGERVIRLARGVLLRTATAKQHRGHEEER
jgi:hypothetical protein